MCILKSMGAVHLNYFQNLPEVDTNSIILNEKSCILDVYAMCILLVLYLPTSISF